MDSLEKIDSNLKKLREIIQLFEKQELDRINLNKKHCKERAELLQEKINLEDVFETQKGLILWVPTTTKEEDKAQLLSELNIVKINPAVPNKKELIALYKTAIKTFEHYPNRILRFYIKRNAGCPDDVDLDWRNPRKSIKKMAVFWNGL